MNFMRTDRLKPHPKNAEFFADLDGEKYAELRRSIEAHGIRDQLDAKQQARRFIESCCAVAD